MNIINPLKELYHKDFKLLKTDLGLSNDIFFIDFNDGKRHVLRVPKDDIDVFVNRDLERQIQIALKEQNLDFNEVYYDDKDKYRITEYVPNLMTFSQYDKDDKYEKVTKMIKTFHQLNIKTDINFDIYNKYLGFKSNITKPLIDYQKFAFIFDEFSQLDEEYILSHNDLVDGNLLFSQDKSFLIDYEYAANNHPYFDLMSFISENQINDQVIRNQIYQLYFDGPIDESTLKTLSIIEASQNLLWAAWANMLYDIRNCEVYLKIFKDKLDALERGLNETHLHR